MAVWIGTRGEEVGASDRMVTQVSVFKLYPIRSPTASAYGLVFRERYPLKKYVSE